MNLWIWIRKIVRQGRYFLIEEYVVGYFTGRNLRKLLLTEEVGLGNAVGRNNLVGWFWCKREFGWWVKKVKIIYCIL